MPRSTSVAPALLVLAALVVALGATPVVEPIERRAFDLRLALRRDGGWPDDLVLVPVDDTAIRENGRWPWPREKAADLLRRLERLGARTILYDAVVAGETTPESDAEFEQALGRTVLAVGYSRDGSPVVGPAVRRSLLPAIAHPATERSVTELAPPLERFGERALGLGHVFVFVKSDGQVRAHAPLLAVRGETGSLPSLPLVGWLRHRGEDPAAVRADERALHLPGGRSIPLYAGEMYLDLTPGRGLPPVVRAADVFAGRDEAASAAALAGRLALVYVDSVASPDTLATPLGATTAGGLLLASAIRTFEGGRVPRPVPRLATLGLSAFLLLTISFSLARRPATQILAVATLLAIAQAGVGVLLAAAFDRFAPIASPAVLFLVAGGLLSAHASRNAERERLRLRTLLRDTAVADGESRAPAPSGRVVGAGQALDRPVEIGRYRIERTLGRGGMGAIFLGRDRDLERTVAIKVLEAADPAAFTRFRREALAVARIVHPHVVQI